MEKYLIFNKMKIPLDFLIIHLSCLGITTRSTLRSRSVIFFCFLLSTVSYSQTHFADVTSSKQILPFQSAGTYGSGVSAADFDNDGNIDFFVSTNENSPNQLYRNLGNGNFEEVGSLVGVADKMRTRAALWLDFNGDHLLDLIVAGDCRLEAGCRDTSVIKLYQQTTPMKFKDVTENSGLTTGYEFTSAQMIGGLAAGDMNNDGYLDLMVTYWHGPVHLYINDGNDTFSDIGASNLTPLSRAYLQPVLYDFNKDGLLDIYLNVDGGENLFWLNNGGNRFTEMADEIGLNTNLNEMGTALGDYDNDGDMDIYITNVTGNQSHNVLFRNDSKEKSLRFTETAKELGVHEGGWGWGTTFFDADNDGFLDLAETNGLSITWRMPIKFWLNDREGSFRDVSVEAGFIDDLDGTALIAFDLDRDGDLDLVESLKKRQGQDTDLRLLENKLDKEGNSSNYIVIKPRMIGRNHFAIGSTVTIKIGENKLTRPILAGNSFFGQEPAEAFFGLGSKTKIDEIIVEWPGGTVSSIEGIDGVNQIIEISDKDLLHKPTNFRIAEIDLEIVTLKWDHISTSETGFLLQRSKTASFESFEEFNLNIQNRAFTDSGLEEGTTYYYRLKTVGHHSSSAFSRIVEVVLQEFLEIPTDLTTIHLDHKKVELHWNDNSDNEKGFLIQRSRTNNFNEIIEYTVGKDINLFTDTTLKPHTQYYYRLQAVGEKGSSQFCDPLNILTLDYVHKPNDLKGVYKEEQVELNWRDQADNESGYLVERSVSSSFQYTREFYVQKDVQHFTDTEIVSGTPFFYRVRAYNENVYSDFSNIFSMTIPEVASSPDVNEFFLFPNPSKGLINIRFADIYRGLITITITNPVGQILFNEVYEKTDFDFEQLLEFNSSPGVYFLSLATRNTRHERKLLLTM